MVIIERDGVLKARLVGREFADNTLRGELFAGTPGLSSLRYMVSRAATTQDSWEPKSIAIMDVKTAFLYGNSRRRIYIRVPHEDPRSTQPGKVALLKKALYGTRDASQIWQDELRSTLKELNFTESHRIPCLFWNQLTQVEVIVHVDDLMCVGDEEH